MHRDMQNEIAAAVTIAPAANRTANTTGSAVDLQGFRSAVALVQYGTVTDGTWTATIEDSDDGSTGWATVVADLLGGAFTARTSANDETVEEVAYLGTKRFIRVVVTETIASTTGALFNALIVRGGPITKPT